MQIRGFGRFGHRCGQPRFGFLKLRTTQKIAVCTAFSVPFTCAHQELCVHAHMVEVGTSRMAPRPYLRPAWDANKDGILEGIKEDLWAEIQKSVARRARRLGTRR